MEALASPSDLEKRWRALTDTEKPRAEVLLLDATAKIVSMCKSAGVAIDETDEIQAHNLKAVTCEMVKRAMLSSVDNAPATSYTQGAGGYTETISYANPTGDLYLTSAEKILLGIKAQRIFSIRPSGGVLSD